jgi:hypothetical protein
MLSCPAFLAYSWLISYALLLYFQPAMSEYGFLHSNRIALSLSTIAEKKAARRKILAQVEQRRRENYKRFKRKMQLQASGDVL